MMIFVKLFFLSIISWVVSSDLYNRDDKTSSQISLKISPSKETVESNIISESQVKYYNSEENQSNTKIRLQNKQDILLYNMWKLLEKAGNNLSPKPSNPLLVTLLTELLMSKSPPVVKMINTSDKRPDVVTFPEEIPAPTEGTTTRTILSTSRPISSTTKAIATTTKHIPTTTEAIATTTKHIPTTKEAIVTTTKHIPTTTEAIAPTSKATTTTEEYIDDDDGDIRPIKFIDTKAFDFGKFAKNMPKVEHGSIQYTNPPAT